MVKTTGKGLQKYTPHGIALTAVAKMIPKEVIANLKHAGATVQQEGQKVTNNMRSKLSGKDQGQGR